MELKAVFQSMKFNCAEKKGPKKASRIDGALQNRVTSCAIPMIEGLTSHTLSSKTR